MKVNSTFISILFPSAAVDVDRIAREVDVQTLQDNIAHVAFCDVENELVGQEFPYYLVNA